MPFHFRSAHTWAMQSCSAQSAVSSTSVAQGRSALTARTVSSSACQLAGAGSTRATSQCPVDPSTSMKSGSGNCAASVVLPIPSGPYTTTLWALSILPRVMLRAIYITHFAAGSMASSGSSARSHVPLRGIEHSPQPLPSAHSARLFETAISSVALSAAIP